MVGMLHENDRNHVKKQRNDEDDTDSNKQYRRPPDYSSNLCPPKTFAI